MLTEFSNALADAVAAAAPSVVQVYGRRRPASGLVCAPDVVVTTLRAVGREDGLQVRGDDGTVWPATLTGWDPASGLAVLAVPGLTAPAARVAEAPVRVGHVVLALARSWSNAATASAGIVSVIGGPLPTGRRRSIAQVIRTTAPMHDGFAGGALVDTSGALVGVTTAMTIRGLQVAIPAAAAWATAATVIEHGRVRRGFLGVAGQPVALAPRQQLDAGGAAQALLIVNVTDGSPAAAAGLLVGDLLLALDGHVLTSPDDLLDLLVGDIVGRPATVRVLRGGAAVDVTVQVGERPTR